MRTTALQISVKITGPASHFNPISDRHSFRLKRSTKHQTREKNNILIFIRGLLFWGFKKKDKTMELLLKILAENNAATVWIDILWIIFVLVVSPLLFLFTMAINELPVLLIRQLFRMLRTKNNAH